MAGGASAGTKFLMGLRGISREEAEQLMAEARREPATREAPDCDGFNHVYYDEKGCMVATACTCPKGSGRRESRAILAVKQKFPQTAKFDRLSSIPGDEFNGDAKAALAALLDRGAERPKAIMLHGHVGTGKTTLACAYAYDAIRAGMSVNVLSCSDLAYQFSSASGHGDDAKEARERLHEFMEADVLVIDDINWATRMKSAGKDAVLSTFENTFAELLDVHQGFMVMTGNFGSREKSGQFDLELALGERVWSRLRGRAESIRVGGEDRRPAGRR